MRCSPMNLPLRTKLTAWYTAVLALALVSFAWIADYGFQHSIEATVNDASRADLTSIRQVLVRTMSKGAAEVADELSEVAGLWAGGALLEVTAADGRIVFRSPAFQHLDRPIPDAIESEVRFATANLDLTQYRIASQIVDTGGQKFRVRAAVPTEPFDQALDRFRSILRRIKTVGDHKGDSIADMAYDIFGQDRVIRNLYIHVRENSGRR